MDEGVRVGLTELVSLRYQAAALALPAAAQTGAPWAGDVRSLFRGRGVTFEESRLYQPGDDIRGMDWKVTARTDKPHVKVFREERERPVFLLVDLNPGMAFGTRVAFKSVVATRLAGLLGWVAALAGDRLGGVVLTAQGPVLCRPAGGERGLLPLLRALSDHQPRPEPWQPTPLLAEGLARLRRVAHPGALIILLSDFSTLDAAAERWLTLLAPHHTLLGVAIHDPLEATLPATGPLAFTNGMHVYHLDTDTKALRDQHQRQFAARQERVSALFKGLAAPLLTLTTETSPVTFVRQEMPTALLHRRPT
ncbi:MAG: DUF58 domain-containing protein [Magnetococcales bacterium]|nr:DUF58 domain-containing protein [Magnetococcales bacterium]